MRKIYFPILVLFLLSACQFPLGADAPPAPEIEATVTPTLLAATATAIPKRTLTVCLGEEPNTLYPYGSPNAAARSVLAAVFDGPMDQRSYKYQPVILQRVPSQAAGDALIETVTVSPGTEVVGADGNLVFLDTGVRVRPSGCRSDECAITYDGVSALEMDQMVINFSLLPDLVWSDGEPLTAADSVFAFNLAADDDTQVSKFLVDYTQIYEATDDTALQWWGKPGFIDPTYYTNFWSPLPEHAWSQFTAAELPQIDIASRTPIGWGPYVIEEWVAGDHLRLVKNIRNHRADKGLPAFDELIFRIVPDPNAAVSDLVAGLCDILDPSINLDGQLPLLQQMQTEGQAQLLSATTNTIEWLGLGITPASYDDGYNAFSSDRPDYFLDKRTRQAIALCLDRQQVVDTVLFGLSVVPNTYISPDHPVYNLLVPTYPFDPVQGAKILDEIGWKDADNDPSTPRLAEGVQNVPPFTPLVLDYYTSSASQRRQASEILSKSLGQCGIGTNLIYMSYVDFYAEGPTGPLFGRSFDLAQYAIGSSGLEPPCSWYESSRIPFAGNQWIGVNVTGYKNAEFDAACKRATNALPDEGDYLDAYQETQAIYASDLPAIPLYLRLKLAAARPDLCGLELDPTANPMWNIEAVNYGPECGQ